MKAQSVPGSELLFPAGFLAEVLSGRVSGGWPGRQGTSGVFSLRQGQPVPGAGPGLEQVSAVGRLLYLGQAQPAQEGTYTCECSNVAGGSSQDQQLEVHGEPGWETCPGRRVTRVGDQAPWQGRPHPPESGPGQKR